MDISNEKLKELLVGPGIISASDFEEAVREEKHAGVGLASALVDGGYITDANLAKIIAAAHDVLPVDLGAEKITGSHLAYIPEIAARAQKAIVFRETPEELHLATEHPDNYEFIKLLEKKTGKKMRAYYATPVALRESFKNYSGTLEKIHALIGRMREEFHEENVVDLVNLFLEYAYTNRASDLHLEPAEETVAVRYRVDGVLHVVAEYPRDLHEKIVLRIKIIAHLRTDEHAAAQDGRFAFDKDGMQFDVRVSALPVSHGENVVLRILAEHLQRFTLGRLGLSRADYRKVEAAIRKPHGMILATGPTGSGKTTTLYAVVQELNDVSVNIMTIEDPIEYHVEHIQQTQVNPSKNLLFSTGLRSIVRQDPDIIMVGEIRDDETAKISVNAAMTGHLVLSTLHANDAATAFPRLLDMQVESFLIASSVNAVIAQRLMRKICEKCRESHLITASESEAIKNAPMLAEAIRDAIGKKDISAIRLYRGKGCKTCNETGYAGRTGIFEVMEVNDDIRELITQKASSNVIDKKAKALGMTSMLQDGAQKACAGITTLEEVLRVIKS